MRWFRRWFPKLQDAACLTCGLVLRERRRNSCPVCGDTRRIVRIGMHMGSARGADRMG